MSRPIKGRVPRISAAATFAVLRGARTVREVGEACGWSSVGTAHTAINLAVREGLLAWGPGIKGHRQGTLHATCEVVAASPVREQKRPPVR